MLLFPPRGGFVVTFGPELLLSIFRHFRAAYRARRFLSSGRRVAARDGRWRFFAISPVFNEEDDIFDLRFHFLFIILFLFILRPRDIAFTARRFHGQSFSAVTAAFPAAQEATLYRFLSLAFFLSLTHYVAFRQGLFRRRRCRQ